VLTRLFDSRLSGIRTDPWKVWIIDTRATRTGQNLHGPARTRPGAVGMDLYIATSERGPNPTVANAAWIHVTTPPPSPNTYKRYYTKSERGTGV